MEKISDDIITRFLNNSCSDAELAAVKQWLDESDANAAELFGTELLADKASELHSDDNARRRIESGLNRRIAMGRALEKQQRRKRLIHRLTGIAAVLAVAVCAGIFLFQSAEIEMVYVAAADKSMSVVLPDSTVVYLNKDSRLGYPRVFANNSRRVELEGEGYFEVSHDHDRPFSVAGKHLDVTVLGIHFNFISRDSLPDCVSLIEGSVEVRTSDKRQCVILEPGQKASYSTENGRLTVHDANTAIDATWHNGMIPFENANLKDIADILHQLYGSVIILDRNADLSSTYSGTTVYSDNLESTLSHLGHTIPLRFVQKDGKTIIYSR